MIGVQVSEAELQLEPTATPLDDHSVILALPQSMDVVATIASVMGAQEISSDDYEVIAPSNWQAYEQVYSIVIQNLHRLGAENIVLNHSTGAIDYGYKSGLKVQNLIRLIRLRTTEAPSDTVWKRLTSDD